jgi:hypothetical protein
MNDNPHKVHFRIPFLFEGSASGALGIGAVVFLALLFTTGRGIGWW